MAITYKVTVHTNGGAAWRLNDQLHREDGPAIEYNGKKAWYLNGVEYTEAEFLTKTAPVKEMTMADAKALAGYRVKIIKE